MEEKEIVIWHLILSFFAHFAFANAEVSVGSPVDFGFNETNNPNGDGLPSAPGCPKSQDGYPWLYFGNPKMCFLMGSQGPCPDGQLLFGNLSTNYGHCQCHCQINDDEKWKDLYGGRMEESPSYTFCQLKELPEMNEVAVHKQNGTCIFLETQGFCNVGEWAVKDETGEGVTCVPQCAATSGPLSPSKFDHQERKCIKKIGTSILPVSLSVTIGQQNCEDGMVFSKTLNKCIPKSKAYLLNF